MALTAMGLKFRPLVTFDPCGVSQPKLRHWHGLRTRMYDAERRHSGVVPWLVPDFE